MDTSKRVRIRVFFLLPVADRHWRPLCHEVAVRDGQAMRAWHDLFTFDPESDTIDYESGMLQTIRCLDDILTSLLQVTAPTGRVTRDQPKMTVGSLQALHL